MVGGGDGEEEREEEGKNPYIYKTIMENKKYLWKMYNKKYTIKKD